MLPYSWRLVTMQKRIWDSLDYRKQIVETAHLHICIYLGVGRCMIWESWYFFCVLYVRQVLSPHTYMKWETNTKFTVWVWSFVVFFLTWSPFCVLQVAQTFSCIFTAVLIDSNSLGCSIVLQHRQCSRYFGCLETLWLEISVLMALRQCQSY